MPVGAFHAFHTAWIAELQRALNERELPEGYYALAEQRTGEITPDVLTLQQVSSPGISAGEPPVGVTGSNPVALADAPPAVTTSDTVSEAMRIAARARQLVIRHVTGDRIVAILEIVSPGNKERRGAVDAFVQKAIAALDENIHIVILDLLPPGRFDNNGIHGVLWDRLQGQPYQVPADKPLTVAAYRAAGAVTCYVEPVAVGQELPAMPLFLDPDHYVNLPFAATYDAAYAGIPRHFQRMLDVVG